jgi:hypothetical protein
MFKRTTIPPISRAAHWGITDQELADNLARLVSSLLQGGTSLDGVRGVLDRQLIRRAYGKTAVAAVRIVVFGRAL